MGRSERAKSVVKHKSVGSFEDETTMKLGERRNMKLYTYLKKQGLPEMGKLLKRAEEAGHKDNPNE